MQNRSIISLELQYLLKTTCKTEAHGCEGRAGVGQLVSMVISDSRGFSLHPTCRLILQRKNQNHRGLWNATCTSYLVDLYKLRKT